MTSHIRYRRYRGQRGGPAGAEKRGDGLRFGYKSFGDHAEIDGHGRAGFYRPCRLPCSGGRPGGLFLGDPARQSRDGGRPYREDPREEARRILK
jgi:hypothetical protein